MLKQMHTFYLDTQGSTVGWGVNDEPDVTYPAGPQHAVPSSPGDRLDSPVWLFRFCVCMLSRPWVWFRF